MRISRDGQILQRALKRQDLDTVKEIISAKKVGVNEYCHEMRLKPIHQAALNGWFEAAEYLVEAGSEIDPLNGMRETPLQLAACYGHVEIMQLLLDRGADPTHADWRGKTILQSADEGGFTRDSDKRKQAVAMIEAALQARRGGGASGAVTKKKKATKTTEVCHVCTKPGDKICGKCKNARYCSLECQKKDWATHKLSCTRTV